MIRSEENVKQLDIGILRKQLLRKRKDLKVALTITILALVVVVYLYLFNYLVRDKGFFILFVGIGVAGAK